MVSSSPRGENRLGREICAPLALNKINLTFLTHLAGGNGWATASSFCTALSAGLDSFSLLKSQQVIPGTMQLNAGTVIVALYPHSQRPEIMGHFLHSLAQGRIMVHGLASSPAAITAVISGAARDRAVQHLFNNFHFSSYPAPQDFYEAQRPPDELLQQVVAAYQEKVIKIYCLAQEHDLDLWRVSIPSSTILQDLAAVLGDLGAAGWKVPFLVAVPWLEKRELLVSFCISQHGGTEVRQFLDRRLPGAAVSCLGPTAAIFIHGPHFGDRYGVADTLLQALDRARVSPLALSCTISSISTVLKQQELGAAVQVLEETFEAPQAQACPRPKEHFVTP